MIKDVRTALAETDETISAKHAAENMATWLTIIEEEDISELNLGTKLLALETCTKLMVKKLEKARKIMEEQK